MRIPHEDLDIADEAENGRADGDEFVDAIALELALVTRKYFYLTN